MIGRRTTFDFDGPPPPADWIVEGLIERGTITVLSADSGAGKSIVAASIAVAIIKGQPWIGRKTSGHKCMYIDEENFYRVIAWRLKALGMTNADRENLCYFLRAGVQLGTDAWAERVEGEVDAFKPDLLVIDTASAATSVEVNDNNAVTKLYSGVLRPLADESAVLLLHHERKPQQGSRRHAGHAMMGARQWAGQADAHIALEKQGDVYVEDLPDGIRRKFPLKLELPKNRDGGSGAEKIAIVSEHDKGSPRARWMRVEKVGKHE